MDLWSDFHSNRGRLIHKWKHYFPVYERHFCRFRNQAVTILEIGCGDGGSMQMWKRYFGPYARIIGIDIRPECKAFEEDQIQIRIGDQGDTLFLDSVMAEFGPVQILIDDGSHLMHHIQRSFAHLYYHPLFDTCGVYLIEDLHTAYWDNFGGGHLHEQSFIEIAKRHVDELNAYHTRGAVVPGLFTDITLSVHFYDSIVVYERGRRGPNQCFKSDAHGVRLDVIDTYVPPPDIRPSRGEAELLQSSTQRPAEIVDELRPYFKFDPTSNPHAGVEYIEFLKLVSSYLKPRSYLEIGTKSGTSLRQFECDAICIDPAFKISQDVLLGRKKTFFFQMTSDDFFAEIDPKTFFPRGVDVGFLDGLHHFEALLRDFINFERCSHKESVAILHGCLPTDLVMTSRTFRWGGWTGDVWKILYVLKKYRSDLRILLLDCPPTGLVACHGLDAASTVLQDNLAQIIEEFSALTLDESGLQALRTTFPLVDTRRLLDNYGDIRLIFAPDS